jgi:hypothetical protein
MVKVRIVIEDRAKERKGEEAKKRKSEGAQGRMTIDNASGTSGIVEKQPQSCMSRCATQEDENRIGDLRW